MFSALIKHLPFKMNRVIQHRVIEDPDTSQRKRNFCGFTNTAAAAAAVVEAEDFFKFHIPATLPGGGLTSETEVYGEGPRPYPYRREGGATKKVMAASKTSTSRTSIAKPTVCCATSLANDEYAATWGAEVDALCGELKAVCGFCCTSSSKGAAVVEKKIVCSKSAQIIYRQQKRGSASIMRKYERNGVPALAISRPATSRKRGTTRKRRVVHATVEC